MVNPSQTFTRRLVFVLVLGSLVVASVTATLVGRTFARDFARSTAAAVESQRENILLAAGLAGESGNTAKVLERLISEALSPYSIVHVSFYRRDGLITYSYDPDLRGKQAGTSAMQQIRAAELGEIQAVRSQWGSIANGPYWPALEVFLPIREPVSGQIIGVAEVVRDYSAPAAAVRDIQLAIAGLAVLLAGLLFYTLREAFDASTRAIRSRTEALRQALQEVAHTYDATLWALSVAIDVRDDETENHSRRVAAFAVRLGTALGLTGEPLELLRRGALLHDVGKIGVPDAILRKPGPLTEEEWVQMRSHPEVGAAMLSGLQFLEPALPIVLHHHERWDGTGYPAQFAGDEIPLEAQIFAVVDALDAITSPRPYRQARSFAEARAEIARSAGTHFNPAIVEAFLAIPEAEWRRIAQDVSGLMQVAD